MGYRGIRSGLVASVAIYAVAMASPASAQTKAFNVPAQPATTGIPEVARQADVQILVSESAARGKTIKAVRGKMSVDQALRRALSGTGLRVSSSDGRTYTLASVTTADSSGAGSGAASTMGGDSAGQDSDIVVTASKRSERLLEVPVAVSAIKADTLTRSGATRLEDFAATAPGVSVANAAVGGGQTQVVIRGITTGVGGNPLTAAYIDDAPITSATQLGAGASFPDLDPADLERIEFLRGPQGTLYGAASLGGLVKYVTRKPEFDRVSGRVEMDLAGAAHGDLGAAARGRINIPLGDSVAMTASGFYRLDPGFIDNIASGKQDWNSGRYVGGRFAIAVRPTANVTLQASVLHQDIRNDANATIDTDNGGRPLYGDLQVSRPPGSDGLRTRFTLLDFTATGNFDGFDVVSDTSYSTQKTTTFVDYTRLVGGLLDSISGQPAGTLGAVVVSPFTTKKFTQEVRAESTSNGFLGWQVGMFYTRENAVNTQLVEGVVAQTGKPAPASFGLPPLGDGTATSRYEEIAGFGDITLNFTSQLSLTGGLRYSHNTLRSQSALSGILLGNSIASGSSSDDKITYLINPIYKITPGIMLYGRVASGYRPNGPNVGVANPATYGPDTVVSYEVGAKGALFDRILTFDVSAFLIDWQDIQIQQREIGPGGLPVNFVGNAGKARSQGVEAAISLRPATGLTFDANVAYTDARLTNTTALANAGDRLPTSARWAGQAGAEYRFNLASDWSAFGGVSVRFTGRRLGEFTGSPLVPRFVLPSYQTIDLRAGVEHDGFSLSAYLRNAADKRGYTGAFGFGSYTTVGLIQPRSAGLAIAKAF